VFGRTRKKLYFWNNVWHWRPLWDYCHEVAPDIIDEQTWDDCHQNMGAGLRAVDARTLAARLREEIVSGRTAAAAEAHAQTMAAMPDEACSLCGGTGKRTDEIAERTDEIAERFPVLKERCNGCDGKGTHSPIECSYVLSEDNVIEFAAFLEQGGGFRVW
jgi:hypothetical protein